MDKSCWHKQQLRSLGPSLAPMKKDYEVVTSHLVLLLEVSGSARLVADERFPSRLLALEAVSTGTEAKGCINDRQRCLESQIW